MSIQVTFGNPSKFSRFGKPLSVKQAYNLYTQGVAFKLDNGKHVNFGSGMFSHTSRLVNKFGNSGMTPANRYRHLKSLRSRLASQATKIQSTVRGNNTRKANPISTCPVCLESKFTKKMLQPWECKSGHHSVCPDCSQSIAKSETRRCPMCRAPPIKNESTIPARYRDQDFETDDTSYPVYTPTQLSRMNDEDRAFAMRLRRNRYSRRMFLLREIDDGELTRAAISLIPTRYRNQDFETDDTSVSGSDDTEARFRDTQRYPGDNEDWSGDPMTTDDYHTIYDRATTMRMNDEDRAFAMELRRSRYGNEDPVVIQAERDHPSHLIWS